MKWIEYKQHMAEEWEFHKRHPEMLLVWAIFIASWIYCLTR